MDKTVCIPGPAGENPKNRMKDRYNDREDTSHLRGSSQPSLSDSNRTGLVSNVPVKVLRVFPGICKETCLLLKDNSGTMQAFMTKCATLKHGTLKPGDTLTIQKAYVITSRDYIPTRLICLDHNSFLDKYQIPADTVPRPLVSKETDVADEEETSQIGEEDDLYLFSESGGDSEREEGPRCQQELRCEATGHSHDVAENKSRDDLLDGLDDPF